MSDRRMPIGLLRRLAVGDASQDEIDFMLSWIETEGLVQPPASVLRRAQRIPRAERPSTLRRLIGSFIPVGPSLPLLSGTRGPADAQVLTFAEDGLEVEVEFGGSGFERFITGQVSTGMDRPSWSPTVARLETIGGEVESDVDAAGMFAFPAVRDPRALLLIDDDLELRLDFPTETTL